MLAKSNPGKRSIMLESNEISNRVRKLRRSVGGSVSRSYRSWIASLAIAGLLIVPGPKTVAQQNQLENQDFDPFGQATGLKKSEILDGWLSLFDGQSLYGWKAESDANWHVENGELRADRGSMGLLRTTSQFDDFEIRVEFKSSATTNSGLFLRTSPKPNDPADDCFELNIAQPDQNPFPTGSLVFRVKAEVDLQPDQWNRYRAVADGNRLKVWVNDRLTVDFQNPKPLGRGYIGLQFREGPIAFRNIVLKPLNQKAIFNSRDLAGWNTDNQLESQFSVTEQGELRMQNGRGQIETADSFGDFVFSTECKTNAKGLNSGVFFRCIPGELMNGYESQIENGYKNGDRTQPVDCGTGGIFRRKDARRIVANDEEWFTKTIVATGPHFAVWVNGYQVSDWTDKRKPDANPRKGLRLEKGSLIFQGHDPTTDVLFKNIRIREITTRRPSTK